MGDTIMVKGANNRFNGKWVIRDVMNKRFTNRIDFLISSKAKAISFNDLKISSI